MVTTGEELDWPVEHGGAVVVRADDEAFAWRPGTEKDRRFPVASVTKVLTGLAALVAVEQGKLGLDDQLPPGLPLPPGAGDELPDASVTIRHLLAHASGLPMAPGQARRPPERRRVYSSPGYRLLGAAVARAVGEGFPEWLERSVLRPLGMGDTTMEPWHGVPADPAAGAVTTLPDLALLARCLLERGVPVVGPELFAEAVTSQYPTLAGVLPGVGRFDPCDWGLGPEVKGDKHPHWMGERRSPASFGHYGASGCFLWVDPAAGVAAAAVTDRDFDDGWALPVWPEWSDRIE